MAKKVVVPAPQSFADRLAMVASTCSWSCASFTFDRFAAVAYYISVIFFVAFMTLPFRSADKSWLSKNNWHTLYIIDFTALLHIAFELDETSRMFKRVVGLTAVMGFVGFAWLLVSFDAGSQDNENREKEEKKKQQQQQQEEEKKRKDEEEEKRLLKERRRAARRESMIREGSARESTPGL